MKICFFEFTAIPLTSPKYMPEGNLKKFGVDSNAISGTASAWAKPAINIAAPAINAALIMGTRRPSLLVVAGKVYDLGAWISQDRNYVTQLAGAPP
jgi:hypothetical protein